jgi:hypothetical protein
VDPSQYPVTRHAWAEAERLDTSGALRTGGTPDVGHLTAGDYDRDALFLIASDKDDELEVKLGSFIHVHPHTKAHQLPVWDGQLKAAWAAAGYALDAFPEPGWIVVPDCS